MSAPAAITNIGRARWEKPVHSIPVAGSVDDLAVTALVLRWAGRRVGRDQLRRHWAGSEAGFGLLVRLLGLTP